MRISYPKFTKRSWAAAVITAVTLGFGLAIPAASADLPGGCDFAPTGTTPSCVGPLAGSTFEGGDGNLLVNTSGNTDWVNAPSRVVGIDKASGTGDNAFGQGTKEDNPNVTLVTGSIPPNKSNLTRFYVGSEFVSGSNFLYLAWERDNALGNANMDFEINQVSQVNNLSASTTGPVTITRTPGDLLVTYDFNNGGGKPVIGLNRWLTSATVPTVTGFTTNVCLSSNTFPCWGDHVDLNGTDSEGAVNNLDAVSDPIATGQPLSENPVPALEFGEAAINLTAAGVFPAGTCSAFGSVFLKSRSSSSFTSEVKDFVSPQPVNISNCGTVNIIKHTDPRGINQDFSYTSTIPNPASGSNSPNCSTDPTPSSFTLNDKNGVDPTTPITAGTLNTEHCANVPAGSYTVTEGAEPAGFTLESLHCTTDNGGSGSQNATNPFQADITVTPGSTVTCTYTNQGSGAIQVNKTGKNLNLGTGPQPLAGATFMVGGQSKTTDASGTVCFEGLPLGTPITVTETAAPTGYAIDTASKSVTLTTAATCSSSPTQVNFTDTPLTDISVHAQAELAGATHTTISCVDSAGHKITSDVGPGDPVTLTANGLAPGTYTCTITIDP